MRIVFARLMNSGQKGDHKARSIPNGTPILNK